MYRIDFNKRRDLTSVDREEFKSVLRHFASGVTVVTAEHDGERYGITVSAFASITLDPPIVMVSIGTSSPLAPMIVSAEHYAVHILSSDQEDISAIFASKLSGDEKYADLPVDLGVSGAPVLPQSLAMLECVLEQTLEVGTHTLMFGRVVAVRASQEPGSPLIYYHRGYWKLGQ